MISDELVAEPALVELRDVAAEIEQQRILSDVNLVLRRGEHLGIVGANGAGKSTLLRLIGGSQWPAPGQGKRTYCFDGIEYRDAVEAKRRMTLLGPELQDSYARLGWNFSALAVVVTGIRRTEIPRNRMTAADIREATALLQLLRASHLAERPFLELSRGEQRRVLLARALAFSPDVLLLDEPASGLDARARAELDEAIERVARRATIVATAHTPALLPAVTRRAVEIRDGRVFEIDSYRAEGAGPGHAAHHGRPGAHAGDGPRDAAVTGAKHEAGQRSARSRPLVELRNAEVWVGERCVLQGVNWRLEHGESWLVLGDNGAGKSTFLRLLHGQIRPARGGSIEWPAFDNPRNIWQLRRHIGWASPELQANYRYPTTVEQCVASGFRSSIGLTANLSESQRQRRDVLIDSFELGPLRKRPLRKLSYGQARRALLARTLASEPTLLLLDEPWEGLDPGTIDLVIAQLAAAMQRGTQVVCASHIGDAGLGLKRSLTVAGGTIRVNADA